MYYGVMTKRSISAETLSAVGIRLRMVRQVLDHTQAQWAKALNVNPQILNKWEQGTRAPNIDKLILICASSGCTLDFIFRGRLGLDMKQELREALLNSYGGSDYVFPLFAPALPPLSASSSLKHRPKKPG
jgi:DNA-binding XRE family transcriptional regulator